jgi:hypothetical protein
MTLGFSTHFPEGKTTLSGRPTKFVSKIWKSISEDNLDFDTDQGMDIGSKLDREVVDLIHHVKPKRHTIRRDEKQLWKAGNKIHPVTDNRTPERFQFAPTLECTGKERIIIVHPDMRSDRFKPFVVINGENIFPEDPRMKELAINDGFDSVEAFFDYFDDYFEGWIIHWTPIRYAVNKIEVKY